VEMLELSGRKGGVGIMLIEMLFCGSKCVCIIVEIIFYV
jgi:hypothetical protein